MGRRLTVLVLPIALTVALIATVGWPDVRGSIDGVSSGGTSSSGAFAVIALLCWAATGIVVAYACARILGTARSERSRSVRHWRRLVLVSAGIALLVAGIVHHQQGYRVCCANEGTAQQADQLVR